MTCTRTALHRDEGASAVEYALLVVAIAAVIAAVVFGLGILTKGNFTSACTNWDTAAGTSNC
jgi:pilus assembly protein Flp/PilA